MKAIIVFFCVLTLAKFATAQSIYYGYPVGKEPKTNDKIIVSLPDHLHVRFYETPQTSALIQFLNSNLKVTFNISIHLFIDSPEYDLSISNHLKKSLEELLALKCKECNVNVIAKGRSSPIFFLDDNISPLYRKMNTRMEISIE